jgi:hypothetical protein
MKLLTIASTIALIIFSHVTYAQWTSPDISWTGRAIQCFVTMDTVTLAGTNGGMLRSANNGTSWANYGGLMGSKNILTLLSLTSYPFNVLSGTINYGAGGTFQSTDYGADWSGFPTDLTQPPNLAHVNSILKIAGSSEFWAGTEKGVYVLPQYYPLGSWIPINTGLPSVETKVRVLLNANGEIFAGTNGGIYILTGSLSYTWVQMNNGLTNTNVTALKSVDGYLIAGTSSGSVGGIYISADTGKTWTLSNSDPFITSILTIGPNIFAGSLGNGVWLSKNYGSSWTQVNTGLGSGAYNVLSLGANDQYLFAGTVSSSFWRRPLSQMITVPTAVSEMTLQPKAFSLEQNYPNPFNPSTTIPYQLAVESKVTLEVYNVLGQVVKTLADEMQPAGQRSLVWNAASYPSGVYFYRIVATPANKSGINYSAVKKLVLLK